MSTDFVCFWRSIHAFKEHMSFVWIYSQLQIHTMSYTYNSDVNYNMHDKGAKFCIRACLSFVLTQNNAEFSIFDHVTAHKSSH